SGRAAAGVVSAGVGHVVRRVEAVVDRAGWRRCRAAVLYRAVRRVLRARVGPLGEVVAPRTTVVVPLRFVLAGQVRTAVGGDLQRRVQTWLVGALAEGLVDPRHELGHLPEEARIA